MCETDGGGVVSLDFFGMCISYELYVYLFGACYKL